jgi:hypothetical protein
LNSSSHQGNAEGRTAFIMVMRLTMSPISVVAAILLVIGECSAALPHGKKPYDRSPSLSLFDARALQAVAASCPTSYSLLHCIDPAEEHVIPCDGTTCLWDLNSMTKAGPPGICAFIKQIDIKDNLPDELKPCVLWNQFFGSVSPTISPKPTMAPIAMPASSAYIEFEMIIGVLSLISFRLFLSIVSFFYRRDANPRSHHRCAHFQAHVGSRDTQYFLPQSSGSGQPRAQ